MRNILTKQRLVGLRSVVCVALALTLAGCSLAPSAGTTSASDATTAATSTQDPARGTNTPSDSVERPAGWDDATHGADVEPNVEVVFPDDSVNTLTITIAPDDWNAMLADMTEIFGDQGSRQQGPQAGGPGAGGPGGGQGAGPRGVMNAENPMWVSGTVTFNGETWTNVGVRFKGNSSLANTWSSGSLKLPLKLDFDQYENTVPAITDQRFYGFKQLSFSNGFGDSTYMREVVAYELLDAAGLTAAHTAYYKIVLDYGEGPVDMGLYVAIEVVDDTVIERVYGDDDGNIYEADGAAASLAAGTQDQIQASFQKENNTNESDWSDVEALYATLNSDLRTTDPAAWRAQLETLFNVDDFLTWLALKTTLQHWDSYGSMSHNYYLYANPATDQLDFISWDHNQVLGSQGGPGGGRGGGGPSRATSFDLAEVGDDWPLIRYLLDDDVYQARYVEALRTVDTLFDAETLSARYQALSALIEPAIAEADRSAFKAAVDSLTQTTIERDEALTAYLATLR